jgi:hypothetical protein
MWCAMPTYGTAHAWMILAQIMMIDSDKLPALSGSGLVQTSVLTTAISTMSTSPHFTQ